MQATLGVPPKPSSESVPQTESIAQLHVNLLSMPFPTFAQCVVDLLTHLGYSDVALMKPMHRRGKGRNAHGGFDIQAWVHTGFTRSLVIAQVKQYHGPVPRAFVDELRGTMLRLGATQGLLVATASFAPAAREAADSGQHSLPVRLIDGMQLSGLLLQHQVPVPAVGRSGSKRTHPRGSSPHASEQEPLISDDGCGAYQVARPRPQDLAIVVTVDAHTSSGTSSHKANGTQ